MLKVYVGNNISRQAKIVSHDSTLRSVLEDANVDYSVGMTSLDGATLQAGDLDKTFTQMGITGDQCYLLNTAKAVNAAGIKVLAQNAVIASGFTPEQVKEVAKYRPGAMKLFDPETKEETFVVSISGGDGEISKFGACYGSGKTSDGKAVISLRIPDGKDVKEFIEETIGVAILNLQKVENQWNDALQEIATEKAAVLDSIEVL